ncbi:MAG: enoyl-CoA hydratase/isomerase family protein [Candidatus Dormibacteraceae bacterium]
MRDLELEVHRGVATLSINRPKSRNAIALQTMAELDQALDDVLRENARVLVIRGAGSQAFCAGGDLKELEQLRSEADATSMAARMRATLDRLPQLPIPVIAGVNGDALGGGAELAVACDFRVAASHARIAFAQVTLGIMPAWGANERLAELVGRGRALYLLLGGQAISAADALGVGLFEEVAPSEAFEARLREIAERIATAPTATISGIKRAVNSVRRHRHPELAGDAIEAFARTWAHPDHWTAVENLEKQRRAKN